MGNVTIEFYGSEYGDWFPLSYIIPYDGMARVFSYDTPRDTRMKGFPVSELVAETNRYILGEWWMQHLILALQCGFQLKKSI
jgi:hypothetical protein